VTAAALLSRLAVAGMNARTSPNECFQSAARRTRRPLTHPCRAARSIPARTTACIGSATDLQIFQKQIRPLLW
jgi:hypothetical protein